MGPYWDTSAAGACGSFERETSMTTPKLTVSTRNAPVCNRSTERQTSRLVAGGANEFRDINLEPDSLQPRETSRHIIRPDCD
jgi:hypothetical protein